MIRLGSKTRISWKSPLQSNGKRKYSSNPFSIEQLALQNMVDKFRQWGHIEAQLDPLGLKPQEKRKELQIAEFQALLQSENFIDIKGIAHLPKNAYTAQDTYDHLKSIYCGKMGIEYAYISDIEEREWISRWMESTHGHPQLTNSEKKNAYTKMIMAEVFENFMAKKFSSFKRYSGEGCESLMPALDTIISTAASTGVKEVVVGMPHRGRLAFLVSQLGYPAHKLFWKVKGNSEFPAGYKGIDDVTSHIAQSIDKTYGSNGVHVSLVHNPSHLEIINSVACGKVKAKRDGGSNAMCLLMHGDAAFSGQGCVQEALSLSQLKGYSTNGTVHIVVNNQIGFTTANGRSSRYCSDVAKSIDAPIIHINGESISHVIEACKMAVEYRNTFKKDVIIDLVGYRRHGHNEVDEPSFTQPQMYESIRKKVSFPIRYKDTLITEGVVSEEKHEKLIMKLNDTLESEFSRSQSYMPVALQAFQNNWSSMRQCSAYELHECIETGFSLKNLVAIGLQSVLCPDSHIVHERLQRTHIEARKKMLNKPEKDIKVDWATAEAMAFGSLLLDGYNIRMSGQDSIRGTFSHRHHGLIDQHSENIFFPLNGLKGKKGNISVINSNLSELAVMGFELGYSWENPNNMVIWEAQFGDFFNGAQIVIDQFIASTESKWMRQSGLVLLLPHGYDGAGPDHSSGNIERFLQLCDSPYLGPRNPKESLEKMASDVNMSIVNLTTPANYFHLLRRQQKRPFRKPVVVMAPKTLLRSPNALSELSLMGPGTSFSSTYDDPLYSNGKGIENAKRIIFCTGKVYYDLVEERQKKADKSTAIIRIEELAPFPFKQIKEYISKYSKAGEYIWIQEEPLNQGGWSFVRPHIEKCLDSRYTLQYVGREALPASAVGLSKYHNKQFNEMMNVAFPS